MDSTRKDTDALAVIEEDTPVAPAASVTRATRAFYDYEASRMPAPGQVPRPMMLPVETIGYWFNDLSNHGPIVRFWSYDECTKLISFANWHTLVQRGHDVLAAIKARGAPMRKLDSSASMQLQASMWVHDLQYDALDARVLAGLGAIIATPLPDGVLPPQILATLRPEHTAPEWLEAPSTADVHENYALQIQRTSAGQLH